MANAGKLEQVRGVVEAISRKFNGAVLVNGKWYNFARDVKNTAIQGGEVVLTLEPWEAKGKSGLNIIALDAALPKANGETKTDTSKGVDLRLGTTDLRGKPMNSLTGNGLSKEEWAAKDRRISRQGCIQVAVQVTADYEKAVELANKMLVYVNKEEV